MMIRVSRIAAAAVAMLAVSACSDTPVQLDRSESVSEPLLAASVAGAQQEEVVPGEVLVKFRSGIDAAAAARGLGVTLQTRLFAPRLTVVVGASGSERALAARLAQDARVEYAEPNYLRQPTTLDSRLWAFYNPGGLNMRYTRGASKGQFIAASNASVADADEDNIEGYAAGGADVVVGSIDTGVDFTHPELAGRLIAGRDWYSGDDDPTDTDGHGTHTTGTMAGLTVGVAGVAGAAPHVRVYVQRVCGKRGCPTSAIVSAIRAGADYPNLVAMNLSLGGPSESQAETDAIAYAVGKGVLVVASAGNGAVGTVSCPACDPNAISVAATSWQDKLSYYSSWGPGLDISAPGGQCYSNTTPEGCIYSSYMGGGYAWLQGTSMAAPQVTGTAALVASVSGLRGAALRTRIESTVDDLGAPGYDETFGAGRLNTYRAVTNKSVPDRK